MSIARACLCFSLFCLFSWAANADSSETTFRKYTRDGKLAGCGIGYSAVFQDEIYRQGRLTAVAGTIVWVTDPSHGMATKFKLLGGAVNGTAPLPTTAFDIDDAYLDIDGQRHNVEKKLKCEEPQGFCGDMNIEEGMWRFEKFKPITVYFNRPPNGYYAQVSLAEMYPIHQRRFLTRMIQLSKEALKILQDKAPSAKPAE